MVVVTIKSLNIELCGKKVYDGKDEDWREVGIIMHVIEAINNEVKGMFGWHSILLIIPKQAIIILVIPDDAFIRLKHVKQGNT